MGVWLGDELHTLRSEAPATNPNPSPNAVTLALTPSPANPNPNSRTLTTDSPNTRFTRRLTPEAEGHNHTTTTGALYAAVARYYDSAGAS